MKVKELVKAWTQNNMTSKEQEAAAAGDPREQDKHFCFQALERPTQAQKRFLSNFSPALYMVIKLSSTSKNRDSSISFVPTDVILFFTPHVHVFRSLIKIQKYSTVKIATLAFGKRLDKFRLRRTLSHTPMWS